MATSNTLARAIFDEVGPDADQGAILEAFNNQLETFMVEVFKGVDKFIERANSPIGWKQQAVVGHHGIPKSASKKWTNREYTQFLRDFDHSQCQVDYLDETGDMPVAKHGCPVRMGRIQLSDE